MTTVLDSSLTLCNKHDYLITTITSWHPESIFWYNSWSLLKTKFSQTIYHTKHPDFSAGPLDSLTIRRALEECLACTNLL